MASAPALALVFAILVGGIAILLVGAVGAFQWIRLVARGSNPDRGGPVRVAGRAQPLEDAVHVTAPISNESALCYEWVLERDAGQRARTDWRSVTSGSDRVMLAIKNDTGTIHVDPKDAALALAIDETRLVEGAQELPEELSAVAASIEPDERYRVVERRLAPDDPLTATGTLTIADGAAHLHRPSVPWLVERVLAVPFVIADPSRDDGIGLVRDRAIAGFVLGLPPTLLSLVLLFPP